MKKNQFNYIKIVNTENEKFLDYLNIAKEQVFNKVQKPIYMTEKEMTLDDLNEFYTESVFEESCKSPREARELSQKVRELAKEYNANFYFVTGGTSATSNNGNSAVKVARNAVAEWERKNGYDDKEDWSNNPDYFSNYRLKKESVDDCIISKEEDSTSISTIWENFSHDMKESVKDPSCVKEYYCIIESADKSDTFLKILDFNGVTNDMEYILPNNGNIITRIKEKDYYEKYKYLSPAEFKKYNGGVCWDYCLYQYDYFSKNFPNVKCKFFYHTTDREDSHTFMIFSYERKYFWYESSWKSKCGIYEFKSENDAVEYVCNLLQENITTKSYKPVGFITEYNPKNIKIGSSCQEFMDYMKKKNLRRISPSKNIEPIKKYKGQIHFNHKDYTESIDDVYEENVILNKKDLYKDFDKFELGKSNVLLVTGFSGSGKSTLARQIASKYRATHYELDCLVFYINGNLTKEEMKGNEDALLEFVEKHTEIKPKEIPSNKEENNLYEEYIKFLVNWCKNHKDKKYVIEGLQIYEVFDAKNPQSFITSNPVIIKGTSGIVSAYRGTKRNINDMDIKKSSERFKKSVKEFKNMLDWVMYDNPKIEDFSKVFKETMNYLIESEDMSKVNKFHKKDMKFKLSNFKKEIKHHDDKNGKPITIIYKDNDKIVAEAYCDTEPASDGYLWFGTFSINENYRNHDLANQFLNELINKYKVGALAVAKDNEVAIKLYKKFGFIISTERKDDKYYYMYLKKNKMKGD